MELNLQLCLSTYGAHVFPAGESPDEMNRYLSTYDPLWEIPTFKTYAIYGVCRIGGYWVVALFLSLELLDGVIPMPVKWS